MTDARPALVTWSYRLWYLGGALFVIFAVVAMATSGSEHLAIVIPTGLVLVAIGLVVIALARKVSPDDPRWRSALAALTLVVTVLSMVGAIGGLSPLFLIAAVTGLIGSVCAYRPAAEAWFNPEQTDVNGG